MRITFRRQRRTPCLPSKYAHHFDINQMRNDNRLIHSRKIDSDRIGEWTVREELDNPRRVQNDHRESRRSRITCEALRSPRTGFICRVLSSHSCIVGRSATRASSLLRKSEMLMPSRAARDFKMRCTFSARMFRRTAVRHDESGRSALALVHADKRAKGEEARTVAWFVRWIATTAMMFAVSIVNEFMDRWT